ncbi:DUF4236 domain-containing protein [Nocardia tengchongensis]|uniref:DUF4236 domain-containing protein n=1 Tax=Nocardia tengchongensis TaxID=2055889 RepID=UPI0036245DD7
MGAVVRMSKSFGPLRVTASRRGVGYSGKVGPVRVTRRADGRVQRTVGIPGTGIYDTRTIGSKARSQAPPPAQADRSGASDGNLTPRQFIVTFVVLLAIDLGLSYLAVTLSGWFFIGALVVSFLLVGLFAGVGAV